MKPTTKPVINQPAVIGEELGIWRVTRIDDSTGRIEMEYTGCRFRDGKTFYRGNEILTVEKFDRYRRKHWPMPHEVKRNPGNITLGVQSGIMGGRGGF